jgi:hypothetical protein
MGQLVSGRLTRTWSDDKPPSQHVDTDGATRPQLALTVKVSSVVAYIETMRAKCSSFFERCLEASMDGSGVWTVGVSDWPTPIFAREKK